MYEYLRYIEVSFLMLYEKKHWQMLVFFCYCKFTLEKIALFKKITVNLFVKKSKLKENRIF